MTKRAQSEFAHMSLSDLHTMFREVVQLGPNKEDKDFIKRISNEIAAREKPS